MKFNGVHIVVRRGGRRSPHSTQTTNNNCVCVPREFQFLYQRQFSPSPTLRFDYLAVRAEMGPTCSLLLPFTLLFAVAFACLRVDCNVVTVTCRAATGSFADVGAAGKVGARASAPSLGVKRREQASILARPVEERLELVVAKGVRERRECQTGAEE